MPDNINQCSKCTCDHWDVCAIDWSFPLKNNWTSKRTHVVCCGRICSTERTITKWQLLLQFYSNQKTTFWTFQNHGHYWITIAIIKFKVCNKNIINKFPILSLMYQEKMIWGFYIFTAAKKRAFYWNSKTYFGWELRWCHQRSWPWYWAKRGWPPCRPGSGHRWRGPSPRGWRTYHTGWRWQPEGRHDSRVNPPVNEEEKEKKGKKIKSPGLRVSKIKLSSWPWDDGCF